MPIETFSITFCGGCNAAYDRSAFVRELLSGVKAIPGGPRLVAKEVESDVALLVCGCHALCLAERNDCGFARIKRHIIGFESLDYLHMPLEEVKEQLLEEFAAAAAFAPASIP